VLRAILLLLLAVFLATPAHADTMAITYGQTITGTLSASEQDIYTFTAPVDGEVFIRLTSVSGEPGTSITLVRVGMGNQAHTGGDGVVSTIEQADVFAGADYQILVPALATGPSYGGQTYRLFLQSITAPVGVPEVPLNGGGTGSLDQGGEVDFYTVAAQDGDLLRVDVERTSGGIDPTAVFYIENFGSCTTLDTLDAANNPMTSTPCSDFNATGSFAFTIEDLNDTGTELVDPIETGGYAFTVTCVSGPCLALVTTTTSSSTTTTTTTTVAGPTTTTTSTIPQVAGQPILGTKLVLRDKAGKPQKRSLVALAKDAVVVLGDDPRTAGATLRVRSTVGGFDVTYTLPATGWKTIGAEGSGKGYKYADKSQASGPVTSAKIRPGKLQLKAKGAALVHDLAVNPAAVDVVLTMGGAKYCASYGGSVKHVAGKKLTAKNAPAPSACP
jgi:hypothetical protein